MKSRSKHGIKSSPTGKAATILHKTILVKLNRNLVNEINHLPVNKAKKLHINVRHNCPLCKHAPPLQTCGLVNQPLFPNEGLQEFMVLRQLGNPLAFLMADYKKLKTWRIPKRNRHNIKDNQQVKHNSFADLTTNVISYLVGTDNKNQTQTIVSS